MKILKKILIGLVALIALALILALFIRKNYSLEREIVINKPKQEVFDYLKSIKNQSSWSTFMLMDPAMTHSYAGTDGEIGSSNTWKSKIVGNGGQEFKKMVNGERIESELLFEGGAPGFAILTTESLAETQTKVKWHMDGSMVYPTNLMLLFHDMEGFIGNEYAKSLENLKKLLEK
jgi:Polyketide cyclase / dehydrase and lipid transport